MDLKDIRKRINMIDFEILKLLNSRMEFALRTKKFKSSVTDSQRENEVIDYIRSHSQGLIEPEFCKKLFAEIISESKRLQLEEVRLIGFHGEHGAFSEVAARQFDQHLMYISCSEYREIFEAVSSGLLHLGIVPVENTLGSSVTDVNQFLVNTDLQVIGEMKLLVHYSLLTLPETRPEEIRVVYSHRQSLSNCQGYLTKHNLEARPYYDSASSAKMLLRERPEATAAIASSFAAEFYNLEIVAEDIGDTKNNFIRFLILAKDGSHCAGEGNKCSIVFSTRHTAGALYSVLKAFADAGLNLSRIESMPNRDDPGNYLFFLDFLGKQTDPVVAEVLRQVEEISLSFRFLGCYPASNVQDHP